MNKQEIIEKELEELEGIKENFYSVVEKAVGKIRGTDIRLFLTDKDKMRLLILKTWTIRYKVDLDYILRNLLPFWEVFIQRHTRKVSKQGLNVKVSTLTGKKSESILLDTIKKDFPDKLNEQIWKSREIERLVNRYKDNAEKTKAPYIRTLERYVKHYRYKMKQETKLRERIETEFLKRRYRGNPYVTTLERYVKHL
jgi:hypothetical protein